MEIKNEFVSLLVVAAVVALLFMSIKVIAVVCVVCWFVFGVCWPNKKEEA